ncbi:MAG: hypothetical protein HY298_09465 [Verrucomicrobia bacterium]|nr:hypothetical protein [Verrucomicrobiota bacterium]
MTQQQFNVLLCVYALVVTLGFVVGKFVLLPDHVVSAKPNRMDILRGKSKFYLAVFTLANTLVIGCGVVGFIGMFFLWQFAPWLFAGSITGKIFLFPTTFWNVRSGLDHMVNEIELLLDGIILTLVFFGPARNLFFGT